MFHLNESFYGQQMPARAKKLFQKTFKKYHKLDGGDEEIAIHMARQAVEREYTKLDDRWIPIKAAKEIIRHNLTDTDDEDDNDYATVKRPNLLLNRVGDDNNLSAPSRRKTITTKLSPAAVKIKHNTRKRPYRMRQDLHTSSEEEDDNYDDEYDNDDFEDDDMNIEHNSNRHYNTLRNNNNNKSQRQFRL
ncbi:chaB [Malacosoma neustria nucleopolyhedrovirus]|uniref:chaB n=1 Tax=Malacosoma neustria nuclear polyhedrosis virus TaxID=38012 RepID=UPI000E3585F1|nr:chaB [Malacosoma neustria nucleopolyhedrovirus]AUF81573.1 chaB [Malacosoma neustria nucleopolyhedrovirus]